jgi:hypothetical protein
MRMCAWRNAWGHGRTIVRRKFHDVARQSLAIALAAAVVACGGGGGGSGSNTGGSSSSLSGEPGTMYDLSGKVRFSTSVPQPGEMLEIRGAGLEQISVLDIGGARVAPQKQREANGDTVLRVTMPRLALAENQTLRIIGMDSNGDTINLASGSVAWCPIGIDGLSSATISPGMAVEVTGSCLTYAAHIRWGGMDIPIMRRTSRGFVISLHASQSASHPIEVRTASGFSLTTPPLEFNVGVAPSLKIDPMIGQVSLLPASSSLLRLIPGKTAMVMARISRPYQGVSRASARVELLNDGGTLFASYPLQGDDAFPDVPGDGNAMENNYFALIPPDQVATIRTVRIVAEDQASNLTQSVSFQPTVAPETSFRLHLVPIARPGGAPAPLPDIGRVQAILSAMFPVSRIEVVAHSPVIFSGSSDTYSQKDLFDLTTLRAQEGAKIHDFYFGVQPEARNAGLAYVGGTTATGFHSWPSHPASTSLLGGTDGSLITDLIAHEVAHNFGRVHTFEDNRFPYANGRLGTHAGLSLFRNTPTTLPGSRWYDVMSYSAPKWFSDYSAFGVQRDAELRAIRIPAARAALRSGNATQAAIVPLRLLEISGEPDSGNVTLHSTFDHAEDALAAQAVPEHMRSGINTSHWVRIQRSDGSMQWYVPTVRSMSDGDAPSVTVTLHLPATTDVANVALVRDGITVREWPAKNSTMSNVAPVTNLHENGGRITARWDPQYKLSLAHVSASGIRAALAVNLTSGQVSLPVPAEAGGYWMWSLTDGLALYEGHQQRL